MQGRADLGPGRDGHLWVVRGEVRLEPRPACVQAAAEVLGAAGAAGAYGRLEREEKGRVVSQTSDWSRPTPATR